MKKLSIVAMALAVVLGTSACSDNKTTQEYINDAAVLSQQKDYNSAVIELKNAIKKDPQNSDVRLALGLVYIELGHFVNAEKELERALHLGASGFIPALALVKTKLNKSDDVYQYVADGAGLADDQYISVLAFAGIAALQDGNIALAQDYFSQAIAIDPNAKYSGLAAGYLAITENELDKALLITNELNSTYALSEALLLQGNVLGSLKRYKEAAEAFQQYISQHPQAFVVEYFAIDNLLKANDFEVAEKKIDGLLARFKNAPLANQFKAQIEYQKKNYAEAKTYADLASQQSNNLLVAKMISGVSAFHLGNYEQAYANLLPLEDSLPLSHPVKKILFATKMQLGYAVEAANTLSDLESLTVSDIDFLQASSSELIKAGNLTTAINLIDKAVELSPEDANLMAYKGSLLISQNDLTGIKALEQALTLDPGLTDVELALALQYLASGEESKAQAIADKWISTQDNKITGHLLQGLIYTKLKKPELATNNFQQALELEPNNISALYNLAVLSDNEGNVEEAENYYIQVINLVPGHEGALGRLSGLKAKNNELTDNIDFLTKLSKENPKNINLFLALIQNLRMNGEVGKAITLLEKHDERENSSQAYWLILGDTYLQNKELDKASTTFQQAVIKVPQSFILHLRYIGIQELNGHFDSALNAATKAYEQFPNNTRLEMLLAYYELRNNQLEKAQHWITILDNKKVSHPFVDVTTGRLAIMQKNYSLAVESLSSAYEQRSSADNAIYLAQALKFNGQQLEAEKTLESYISKNPDNNMKLILASLYGQKDIQKQIALYKDVLVNQPDDTVLLNNLAWAEYVTGDLTGALKHSEQAYNLAQESLAISETYGVILVANNVLDKGIKVLESAVSKGSKDFESRITLAKAYISKQDFASARTALSQIIAITPDEQNQIEELKAKVN